MLTARWSLSAGASLQGREPVAKRPPSLQPLPASAYRLFVGVDSAARTAVAAWIVPGEPVTRPFTMVQSASGFVTLQDCLLATGIAPAHILIVLEATGTYWLKLAITLVQAGFIVSVINPAQAHDFAKALRHSRQDGRA